MTRRSLLLQTGVWALALCAALPAWPATQVTSPKEHFGFNIGDDYHLATYRQTEAYFRKLASQSDRLKLVDIGKTAEGRTQYMCIISAPENIQKLDRYKEISRKLAQAEGLTDTEAHALAKEGKAVIWIDGGLHATETVGTHQLIETIYQFTSRTDDETNRILKDVIILAVHANPDGQDLVSDWYMREPDPAKRKMGNDVPRLYHKYVGHDNNRDFYMSAMDETTNLNRQLFLEWFPQIMYNHHQTSPAGTIIFAPPFRDPFNYNLDPLIVTGIDLVGAAMHHRFIAEDKPGSTMRGGANFSTWYNGGLRTTTYFHNMIGLLTEISGSPTPMDIPLLANRQLPSGDLPYPIAPQKWHYRQSIDYSLTANRAVLDIAQKYKEDFLYNIYKMGKNSIERGSRDHWTMTPSKIERLKELAAKEPTSKPTPEMAAAAERGATALPAAVYQKMQSPELRDARGYILSVDQPDFGTAVKFINALLKNGITVHKASSGFTANGKTYPAGSYVVKANQAFRPHVLDMFEPQDHPNDFKYEGGPPIAPYDTAGWTLAYQMGVQFDRVLDGFDGPFQKVSGLQTPPAMQVSSAKQGGGYLVSHQPNDAFVLINRVLKAGHDVYWMKQPVTAEGKTLQQGAIYIPAKDGLKPVLDKAAQQFGLSVMATPTKPTGDALKLKPVRIGLWDRYGGSMPSGWVRFLLEQFEFPFEVVYPQTLDSGNLRSKFDVIVFVGGAIPKPAGEATELGGRGRVASGGPKPETIPAEYRANLGNVTADKTIPQLKTFMESGGTVVTLGSSANLVQHLGLPMKDALVERAADGKEKPLAREKYYVPGSVLQMHVDNTHPLAYGLGETVDVFFDNSPVFRLGSEAASKGVKPVLWIDKDKPLRSGWAWGQKYLDGAVAIAEANVGEGKLFVMGPEVTFRAQPHGTFKLLFNGIYYGSATQAKP